MRIFEGRAYQNGIDFLVFNKGVTAIISSQRKDDGKVFTELKNNWTFCKNTMIWRIGTYVSIAIYGLFVYLMCTLFSESLNDMIFSIADIFFLYIIISVAWISTFAYVMLYIIKNSSTLSYHTASHILLNYYDKYKKLPETLEDFSKVETTRKSCVINYFFCILFLYSLSAISIVAFDSMLLEGIALFGSVIVTILIWRNQKVLIYNQKAILNYFTRDELEVALLGIKKFITMCEIEEKYLAKK